MMGCIKICHGPDFASSCSLAELPGPDLSAEGAPVQTDSSPGRSPRTKDGALHPSRDKQSTHRRSQDGKAENAHDD